MTADPLQNPAPSSASLPATPSGSSKLDVRVQREHSLALSRVAVKVAAENRGQDIMLLDLTEQTSLFDFFVIVTGASRRQLAAIGIEIDRTLKTQYGERKLSASGTDESRWCILDYGNFVVHLFDEETRQFYDLESLWGDALQIDITDIVDEASTRMTRVDNSVKS